MYLSNHGFISHKKSLKKKIWAAKTSLFWNISQNCLGKMTTIIHSLIKMHTPSYNVVAYLPGYLTMVKFCLKSVCGESYGSAKIGAHAVFCTKFTKLHA